MSVGCSARFEISKEKIHIIIIANPLKLSAGPCFSQKAIWDEKCLCFAENRVAITGIDTASALVYTEQLHLFSRQTAEAPAYRPEKAAFRTCHVLSRWTAGVCVSWYGVRASLIRRITQPVQRLPQSLCASARWANKLSYTGKTRSFGCAFSVFSLFYFQRRSSGSS